MELQLLELRNCTKSLICDNNVKMPLTKEQEMEHKCLFFSSFFLNISSAKSTAKR